MTVVLVALATIGVAGVVVGIVAHLVVLPGTLAWMGPTAPWLMAQALEWARLVVGGTPAGGAGQPWQATPLAVTALWMFLYGVVFLLLAVPPERTRRHGTRHARRLGPGSVNLAPGADVC